jgi:2-polyprenyl-3-methyl-5-hydroxy-6-metoxy-1,4-benzoquinol methylase
MPAQLQIRATACESFTRMNDQEIIDCWKRNSEPWTVAVRERRIRSRVLVTDDAIESVILARSPSTALDIGCGEGWLARKLTDCGVDVLGIDAAHELITSARRKGGGRFEVMAYEDLAQHDSLGSFDVGVCNFSLLGAKSTECVFAAMSTLLNPGGALVVQTLHPWSACGDLPYRDGWRQGSWAGINAKFAAPAPWYFRTLQGWTQTFSRSALHLETILEPLDPETGLPASLILSGAMAT